MSLSRPATVIGSRNRSHIHLVSPQVSKSHAMVVNGGSAGCYIRDLASRTHVLVNGQQVKESELKDGDVIGVGPFSFRFTDPNKKPRRRGGVQTNIPAGALRVSTRTLPFTLDARTTLIGRRAICDIALDDMDVSTTHAVIFELDGKRFVRDLGSRTGTFVNGTAVHQQALEFGDEIKIGPAVMTYAEAGELGEGLDSGLSDPTEDLAATAHLPAVIDDSLDLVFEETPVKQRPPSPPPLPKTKASPAPPVPPVVPVEPEVPVEPVAAEAVEPAAIEPEVVPPQPASPQAHPDHATSAPADLDELDLAALDPVAAAETEAPADLDEFDLAALEPMAATDAEAVMPADLDELDLGALGTSAAAEAQTRAPAMPEVIEPSQESALGIELLPHEEEHAAAAPAAEATTAPEAKPVEVGGIEDLDLAPAAAAPIEAAPPPPPVEPPAPVLEVPAPAPEPKPAVAERDVNELPELPPELAEELELEPVDLDDVEVLAKTEPTPESALDLDRALPAAAAQEASLAPQAAAPAAQPVELLSDSMLGREVEAFEGPGLGPIVEAPTAAAAPEVPTELAPAAEIVPTAAPATPEIDPEADALIFEEPAPAAPAAEAAAVPDAAEAVEDVAPAVAAAPPLTLDHTVTPAEAEPVGAVEAPVEPSLPATVEVTEPELELEPAAEVAPATADHEAAPAELDFGGMAAATTAEIEPLPEPVAEAGAPVAEAPESVEPVAVADEPATPKLEPEPVAAIEPAAEATESELEPVADVEVPPSADEMAKTEDVVERWLREQADEPESLVRPEGVPAAAELTTPVAPLEVEPTIAAEAEPAAAAEPFPINPELLGEDHEPSPTAAGATSDPLVFQESAASADVPTEEPAASIAAEAPVAPEAELPAVPVAEQPAEPVGEAAPQEQPPGKSGDLFFGLERDTASFLGGMPLQLPPLNSPFAQQRVDFTRPAAPPAPLPEPGPAAPQAEAEEPLPVFDHEAFEYPDETAPTAEAVEPAAPAPGAPVAPVTGRGDRPAPPPPARSTGERKSRTRDTSGAKEPQAPARRVASSPFDLNFEDVPTDRIEIPPFGGAPTNATRGQVTTAFDGLAMPPVRETDVFSNNRAPGSPAGGTPTIPPFPGGAGSSAAPAQGEDALDDEVDGENLDPIDLSDAEFAEDEGADETPSGETPLPGDESGVDEGQQSAGAATAAGAGAAESRRARPLAQPNRRPPSYPTDPAAGGGTAGSGRPGAKKKRWRIGKWGIFGLMMVCMIAVSGGMAMWIRTHPNLAQIVATMKFDRLEALTEAERQRVLAEQRTKLSKPEVRAAARDILPGIQANVSAGFLDDRGLQGGSGVEAAVMFSKFADSLELPGRGNEMRLRHATSDPLGDAARVRAVLAALYAENKPLIDAKGQIDHDRDEKQEALRVAQAKLSQLDASLGAARQAAGEGNAVDRKSTMIAALQSEQTKLLQGWNEKTAAVHRLSGELRAAESDVPVAAADPAKPPAQPDEDPQVIELTHRAEMLAAGLKAKKAERSGKADEARKSLAAALKQFESDIAKARGEMKGDSDLARYLDQAERVQSQLKVISGELDARQRSDMERLTTLKRNLSDANESRIREAFAADPQLKRLQETLAMKERQRGSAIGGGLKDDERALDKEITALKLEVESRQDLLTTADGVAPRMKQLEDLINDFLKQMDQDRVRNDQRMAELLKQLASQAPVAGSLPAEQKAFAEKLAKRQAELNKAREQYAAAADAAATESDAQLKAMESDLAAAQAKIDERKKQVADAARAELTAEQQKDRTAVTEALRHKLQIAQQEDREAGEAFNRNRQSLEDAKSDLEKAKRSAQQFAKQDADKRQLEDQIKSLSDDVQRLTKQQEAAIIPIKPDDASVGVLNAQQDHRLTYMLGALLAIALLFLPIVLMAPSHPQIAIDHDGNDGHDGAYAYALDPADTIDDVSDLPLAAPNASVPDDAALAAAMKVETATDKAVSSRDRIAGRGEPAPLGA
jgi:pSer/pThr/pTyr-binding forkhead associated (FHA) protein